MSKGKNDELELRKTLCQRLILVELIESGVVEGKTRGSVGTIYAFVSREFVTREATLLISAIRPLG